MALFAALALVWTAFMPSGIWRCLDGTLCPSGGYMPHPRAMAQIPAPHPCCQAAPDLDFGQTVSPLSGCVLSGSERLAVGPAPTAVQLAVADDGATLMVPPLLELSADRSIEQIFFYADLPPPPHLAAQSGRSPPFTS